MTQLLFSFLLSISLLKLTTCSPGPGLREKVPCIDNGRFYRNPNRDPAYVWSAAECSKYHLCIDGEIFNFECSTGNPSLLMCFAILRWIDCLLNVYQHGYLFTYEWLDFWFVWISSNEFVIFWMCINIFPSNYWTGHFLVCMNIFYWIQYLLNECVSGF